MKTYNKKHVLCLAVGTILLFLSCSEKNLEPITSSKGKPETIIIDGEPTGIPGGAIIHFRLPEDGDILSIKAVYTLTNGTKRESMTSFYGNEIVMEGYNDTLEHEAMLYTINRAQEISEPVPVKFTPLKSALTKTMESVSITNDFGGASFTWRNEEEAPLTFELYAQDEHGEMQIVRIISSSSDSAGYTIRGYQSVPQKFGIIISDIFDNFTPMLLPENGTITPFAEAKLDKKIMKVMILDNDVSFDNYEGTKEKMIDDDVTTFGHTSSTWPVSFTLDLGKTAKLSRLVHYQRTDGSPTRLYREANLKAWEIYACENTPSQSGDWNEWFKVTDCIIIKPSNSPVGTVTDEDIIAAEAGHEFGFPLSMQPFRYLRFKLISSWGSLWYFYPAEWSVYGEYAE
jgi:hypothetical protein